MSRAIFLDFDGVLFDTVKEAYAVCLFAAKGIRKIGRIDFNTEDFAEFRKCRHLIGPAWNYFYLLKAIEDAKGKNGADINGRYLAYMAAPDRFEYKRFEKNFFRSREHLKNRYEKYWLGLNTPYNFLSAISDFIKSHKHDFFIVTTKDIKTVLKLLDANGQNFMPENIYGRYSFEKFKIKRNIIESIMRDRGIKRAIFIDDNRSHLADCAQIASLKVFRPQWGYISDEKDSVGEVEIVSEIKKLLKGV